MHLLFKWITVSLLVLHVISRMPSKVLVEVLSLVILFDSYQKCIRRLGNWQLNPPGPLLKEKKDGGENAPVPDIGEVFRASNSRVLHFSTEPN